MCETAPTLNLNGIMLYLMNPEESTNTFLALICYWCEKPVFLTVKLKTAVCPKCYKLLSGAGIKEREIFRENSNDLSLRKKDRFPERKEAIH